MNNFIGFAGVGSAIIASMGLAMWLEWFCLRWLMRVMPGRMGAAQSSLSVTSSSEELAATAPDPTKAEMSALPPVKATRYEIRLGI